MKNYKNKKSGFIKTVLIIVAALVLLKYIYDFDIVGLLAEGKFRMVLDKIYQVGSYGWNEFREVLMKIINYVLETIKKIFN